VTQAIKVGTDICSITRIREAYEKNGERFLDKILTSEEKRYVLSRQKRVAESLAGRFAAKEAVGKALGVGLRGVGWKEIEIGRSPYGAPLVMLHGRAKERASFLKLSTFDVSISHEREFAIAVVVAV
jgi:holo-[acyl-carrier protein] synthase